MSRVQLKMPGNVHLEPRFFGLLTARGLLRIGVPTLGAFGAVYPIQGGVDVLIVLLGCVVGVALCYVRVYGLQVDQLVRQAIRWVFETRFVQDGVIRTRHDHFVTEDGTVIGVLRVESTNLSMLTASDQRALHSIYQEVLETITYPIMVHSRQRAINLDPYISRLQESERSETGTLAEARTAYLASLKHMNRSELVQTEHYVIIRVSPSAVQHLSTAVFNGFLGTIVAHLPVGDCDQPEEVEDTPSLCRELDRRCMEVLNAVNRGDLSASRITGPPLVDLAGDFHGGDSARDPFWVAKPDAVGKGEFRKQVYITEPPSSASLAWPADLLHVDGLVDVTQVISPRNSAEVVRTLKRTVERLEAEISAREAVGHAGNERWYRALEDAEWMQNLLAVRKASAVDSACYITTHHWDEERCEEILEQVTTRLSTRQFSYEQPVFRTDEAYQSQSPFHVDVLDKSLLMPSSSAAAGFPFATVNAIEQGGVVFGEDAMEGTPVLLDRFRWPAAHMVRMGQTGSGKTYAAKLELLRMWLAYNDLQLYIVDPKQDYGDLVRTLRGRVYTLGEDNYAFDRDVLGFEIGDRGDEQKTDLLCDVVQAIYSAIARDQRRTIVLIDEAHNLLKDRYGRDLVSTLVREARDTNTGITLITQDAADFTTSQEGRAILKNTHGKILHLHDEVDDTVTAFFNLSEAERHELKNLQTGTDHLYSEAVLDVPGLDTKLKVQATAPEHAVIEGRSCV